MYPCSIQHSPEKRHTIFVITASFHNKWGLPLHQNNEQFNNDCKLIMQRYIKIKKNIIQLKEAKEKSWKKIDIKTLTNNKMIPNFSLKDLRTHCTGPYILKKCLPYIKHAKSLTLYINKLNINNQ